MSKSMITVVCSVNDSCPATGNEHNLLRAVHSAGTESTMSHSKVAYYSDSNSPATSGAVLTRRVTVAGCRW